MPRYIDAEKAKETLKHFCLETANNSVGTVIGYPCDIYEDVAENRIDIWVDLIPTEDVRENVHGKWIERKVIEDGKTIEEWQSAKCSVCGKYHTTPYLYNFDDFNYCPNCGARMEEKGECR